MGPGGAGDSANAGGGMKRWGFGRRRREHELDAEVRSYIDELIEEKIQSGLSRQKAVRAARIEAGGIEQVKEEVRAVRPGAWLDALLHDIRYSVRMQGR